MSNARRLLTLPIAIRTTLVDPLFACGGKSVKTLWQTIVAILIVLVKPYANSNHKNNETSQRFNFSNAVWRFDFI
jgi:hypothetical protein